MKGCLMTKALFYLFVEEATPREFEFWYPLELQAMPGDYAYTLKNHKVSSQHWIIFLKNGWDFVHHKEVPTRHKTTALLMGLEI